MDGGHSEIADCLWLFGRQVTITKLNAAWAVITELYPAQNTGLLFLSKKYVFSGLLGNALFPLLRSLETNELIALEWSKILHLLTIFETVYENSFVSR